jgi:hypothetical protein
VMSDTCCTTNSAPAASLVASSNAAIISIQPIIQLFLSICNYYGIISSDFSSSAALQPISSELLRQAKKNENIQLPQINSLLQLINALIVYKSLSLSEPFSSSQQQLIQAKFLHDLSRNQLKATIEFINFQLIQYNCPYLLFTLYEELFNNRYFLSQSQLLLLIIGWLSEHFTQSNQNIFQFHANTLYTQYQLTSLHIPVDLGFGNSLFQCKLADQQDVHSSKSVRSKSSKDEDDLIIQIYYLYPCIELQALSIST